MKHFKLILLSPKQNLDLIYGCPVAIDTCGSAETCSVAMDSCELADSCGSIETCNTSEGCDCESWDICSGETCGCEAMDTCSSENCDTNEYCYFSDAGEPSDPEPEPDCVFDFC
jgi:hypothetical protein